MVTTINKEKYLKLKKYHKNAIKSNMTIFTFEDKVFNISFTENLLYYLESIYEPIKNKKYVKSR